MSRTRRTAMWDRGTDVTRILMDLKKLGNRRSLISRSSYNSKIELTVRLEI